MSFTTLGMVLGFFGGVGLVVAGTGVPLLRRVRLADRLTPYLRDAPKPSRLLAGRTPSLGALGRLARPVLVEMAGIADRLVGGSRSVRRRQLALGVPVNVEEFRIEQVLWAGAGALLGAFSGVLLGSLAGEVSMVAVLLVAFSAALAGFLGRDWWLSAQVHRRTELILAEFPVIADLLALAVTAGEAPAPALERVCRMCRGELSAELSRALAEARAGASLPAALEAVAQRTTIDALSRFVDGILVALERGTPLAAVLRAQAADVREARKRALLATGGRREIAMLVPVVFLILPVTVLFALYPGLVSITLLTR
ncbi:type II secretion system F family protein [Fodinicola feengrottensis]|uniref:Type II secretion system F family protein n=1 Tax=Fodinicola feengrottensis TaxID=435914 RepID=A0ABP4TE67_9ACTN|nr:type II secretion system F family protein [Fodinicola feengrottensis]